MNLEETVTKEQILDCIIELQEKRDKYINYNDALGYKIWMLTNYTQAYIMKSFDFDPFEVAEYKKKEIKIQDEF